MKNKEKISCLECGSLNIIKTGARKNKNRVVQKYKCKSCNKMFNMDSSKNKTYPINIILNSLSYYSLGYTLKESSNLVNKRFKVKTYPQLISSWLKEYRELCSFNRLRNKNNIKPSSVIHSKLFSHKQPYLFKYHRFKVEYLINDYFKGLKSYLVDVVKCCPDELFVSNNMRSSQLKIPKESIDKIKIRKSKTNACKLAELALRAAKSNKERHSVVQDFMLTNDSATVAVEVPVWMPKAEISDDKMFSSILCVDKNITGHIDLVQLKFGMIYVLDFKPEASKENLDKVVSQLFVYALALSVRTGVWLRNFRCAWFDEEGYYEFNPNLIVIDYLKKNKVRDRSVWRKYWSDYEKRNKAVRKR